MSIAESLLVLGTFGICVGVWTTLAVIINQHKPQNKKQAVRGSGSYSNVLDKYKERN